MNITEFTFRLILIFIPGLISFRILHILAGREPVKLYFVLIDSLILGFLNYTVYFLLSRIHVLRLDFTLTEVLLDGSAPLGFLEILITTILSIPTGFLAAFLVDRRIIYESHRGWAPLKTSQAKMFGVMRSGLTSRNGWW
jgi:hypothetical protein